MKSFIVIGVIAMALGVVLGAFGAHGLKARDQKEYAGFFSVLFKSETHTRQRLHYLQGLNSIKTTGDCVFIVDESDEVMFRNLY